MSNPVGFLVHAPYMHWSKVCSPAGGKEMMALPIEVSQMDEACGDQAVGTPGCSVTLGTL